jgi:ferric-dicitrate binding protein FerR (iron transport regulator)
MIPCRQARRIIVDCVRERSGEADRLLLEDHLAMCQSCREDRGRWALLEKLRDTETPALGSDARARVLDHLLASPREQAPIPRRVPPARPALFALAVAGAAVLVLAWGPRVWKAALAPDAARTAGNEPAVAEVDPKAATKGPTLLHAERAGTTTLPGVRIDYVAGTTLRTSTDQRELHLLEGEVDVDVTPGGPGKFRVVAERFTVVVLGTRFVVRPDSVRTLRGHVRVESPTGELLATLGAGDAWSLPQRTTLTAPSPASEPASSTGHVEAWPGARATPPLRQKPVRPPVRLAAPAAPESAPGETPPTATASDQLLREARRLLVSGDTARARDRIAAALAAKPNLRETARAELLTADALLVERQRTQAMEAYRRVGDRFTDLPEGDSADFMAAQLRSERGTAVQARAAFEGYLARHPRGRFAREARDKLSAPTPP